jgi:Ca2+-binding EF-hand superfamily protein
MFANGVIMNKYILAAAMLGLAGSALAQTPPPAPATPADGMSFDAWAGRARERLMALDTDHDGRISKEEFAARGATMGRREDSATPGTPRPDGSRMFDRLDANHDGSLDATEINALLARRFARMDANHDGVLTADERHAMRGPNAPEQ